MNLLEFIQKEIITTINGRVDETAKRDYKKEYEKYGKSEKAKKYRAELNKYNRDKGTYGNGDGKDASHKGGKIVGFESEKKNRGRAEKSRLKKEHHGDDFPKELLSGSLSDILDKLSKIDKEDYNDVEDILKKHFKNDEVVESLLEKCWKGYKIHPKRKTKKLFGKTYPNCVKNEAQKKYKKGDKLKIKLKNGKEFDLTFDSYGRQKGMAFGKFDGDKKPFSLDTIEEAVNESSVSKRRAGAELKQKLKGKRSDGMGKYTATIYGLNSNGKRVELKSLNDLNKYSKFEIDESVNEASKLAMGIAGFTGTRGIAVDDFIEKNKIDAKKLFNFVKKGNLKDRMAFVSAIAGKPNNKMFKMITKQFSESTDGVPQGYNPMVEDKQEIKNLLKKVGNKETKFYDVLNTIEKKYGKNKYRIWLEKSLKSFGANPKHYDYRTNAGAEEKLFQLAK
tara:strand:+ start:771 stop:2117 length:1347 start_codon:yes stop_codon:yes gene_type:complete